MPKSVKNFQTLFFTVLCWLANERKHCDVCAAAGQMVSGSCLRGLGGFHVPAEEKTHSPWPLPFPHCVALSVITMEPYSQDSPRSWKCTESSPALVIKPTLVLSILQCDRADECVYGCNVKLSEDSMCTFRAAQDATVLWPSVGEKAKPPRLQANRKLRESQKQILERQQER